MKTIYTILFFALAAGNTSQAQDINTLVVHEWGTITTQHRADGTQIGRLNRISPSEVLPDFVHRYEPEATRRDPKVSLSKGTMTPGRPDVTMRLETPVLYFYPPKDWNAKTPFDVEIKFRGGVINEFYPNAQASIVLDVDRIVAKQNAGSPLGWDGKTLDNYVAGSLRWQGIALGNGARFPDTDNHAWLAPRKVGAAFVATAQGENEKYLFYRGVAHLDALMQTRLTDDAIQLLSPTKLHWMPRPSMAIAKTWLVDIQPNGRMAMRAQGRLVIDKARESQPLSRLARFATKDYSLDGVVQLRALMKEQLLVAGLFDDEAEAMLETWKDSYFKQPGLRLFYVVPAEWLEYFLPVRISVRNKLTRVLIGRIDLL